MLAVVFVLAWLVRIAAAIWLDVRTRAAGGQFEFADSELYWKLGLQIAAGQPYDDGQRLAQRTPGYPVFLAGCIRLLGPSLTGARHMQAAVGAASCVLLFLLARRLVGRRAALGAAGAAAVYPFAVFLSVVLLSEALFQAVLIVQLLALARLRDAQGRPNAMQAALAPAALVGITGAVATLVRPSWILATPLAAVAIALAGWRTRLVTTKAPSAAIMAAVVALAGFGAGMAPWWKRNYDVFGQPVWTTLWVGASLYDGLHERATGASDMRFMEQPADYGLDPTLAAMTELEQDRYLRARAIESARNHPGRVAQLAVAKFVRFWNPIPNASEWRSGVLRTVSLLTCGPVLLLAAIGAWKARRQGWVLLLLAGPVCYFCAIHLAFVSSVRYREAAMLPVLALAAFGLAACRSGPAAGS
jgi:4-amino-4-deoxy-L-arabinose transferase-like glycosyltransferase